MARVDQGKQIGVDEQRAAADVDHVGAASKPRERGTIQDAVRDGRERQYDNQHIELRQKWIELFLAGEAANAVDRFAMPGKTTNRKAESRKSPGDLAADHAGSQDAD